MAINVLCCTWNVGGKSSIEEKLAFLSRTFRKESCPDVIAICLQEIVSLNSFQNQTKAAFSKTGCLGIDLEAVNWSDVSSNFFAEQWPSQTFVQVQMCKMFGLMLLIFSKESVLSLNDAVKCRNVAKGWHKICGNKGGVVVDCAFNVNQTTLNFRFIGVHLPPHERNRSTRRKVLKKIMKTSKSRSPEADAVFALGDFNFRVERDDFAADKHMLKSIVGAETITDEKIKSTLKSRDQFVSEASRKSSVLAGFKELDIHFAPTYKFIKGGLGYKTSFKSKLGPLVGRRNKIPSWTDRIVYNLSNSTIGLNVANANSSYMSIADVCSSDHKPVVACFDIEIGSMAL